MKHRSTLNHRLNSFLYNNQSVVLLGFLLPLVWAVQFGSRLLLVIVAVMLLLMAWVFNNWIDNRFINLPKLSAVALVLGMATLLTTPSSIPAESDAQVLISGVVYQAESYYADIRVDTYNRVPLFPAARIRVNNKAQFDVGDKVILESSLVLAEQATNPGQFDYRQYLAQQGIYLVGSNPRVISRSPSITVSGIADKLRDQILEPIKDKLPADIYGLYSAMTLGERRLLSNELYGFYQAAGVAHVLVISGMHIGLLASMLMLILTRQRFGIRKSAVITLLLIWGYALISGLSVSVLRAAIMLTIALMAKIFYQVYNPVNTLALAAVIILVINPLSLNSLGWQLSFAATAGILLILPLIVNQYGKSKLVKSIGLVLAAQLVTLPIIINTFNYFPLYSIPANLTIVPVSFAALILGLLYTLPGVRLIVHYPLTWLLRLNVFLAELWASLPYAKFSLRRWPIWLTIIYLTLLIVVIIMIRNRQSRLALKIAVLALMICVFSLGDNAWQLEVTFLDVGQGDSAVIKWPNQYTMVIDGGYKSEYSDFGQKIVLPFLRQAGINRVDALVVSHSDQDHIGGLLRVADQVAVRTLYLTPQAYYSGGESVRELVERCRQQGADIELLHETGLIRIMPNSVIEVYNPENSIEQVDDNNASLVLRLVYGETSVLFTGDIEYDSESRISAKYSSLLKSDIIKVPHHGSRSSSTDSFISWVNPRIAVFSAGRDNNFGHPHQEVIERYQKGMADIWRTDLHGAITITSTGRKVDISSYLQTKQAGELKWQD